MVLEYGFVSVRGKSHIELDKPNQDFIDICHVKETVILIAADGAGSSRFSDEGSRRIVTKVLNSLKNIKDHKFLNDPLKYEIILRQIIIDSVNELRANLTEGKSEETDIEQKEVVSNLSLLRKRLANFVSALRPYQKQIEIEEEVKLEDLEQINDKKKENKEELAIEKQDVELSDYASTFLLVISSPISTLTAHVGDGYIIGCNYEKDNLNIKDQLISLPRNGEYDNQTYFFTDNNWQDNLVINSKKEFFNFCILMTDGADPFWIAQDRKSLHEPLFNNFIKIRNNHPESDLSTILQKVFTFEKISGVSSDDASIGIILR